MKRTNSTKSHPVLGHIDQNSLVLELQDMLNHGSHPELFEHRAIELALGSEEDRAVDSPID